MNRWILKENTDEVIIKRGRPVKFDTFDGDPVARAIEKLIGNNDYVSLRTLQYHLAKNG